MDIYKLKSYIESLCEDDTDCQDHYDDGWFDALYQVLRYIEQNT